MRFLRPREGWCCDEAAVSLELVAAGVGEIPQGKRGPRAGSGWLLAAGGATRSPWQALVAAQANAALEPAHSWKVKCD